MLLLCSGTDNCILKVLLKHSIMYRLNLRYFTHTHCRDYCMFSYIRPWLQKLPCVCWQCCLLVSDLTVELCFYRLHRFTCSAAGRLKDKREGVVLKGGVGELPIIWCCLSCIIPRFQMEGKCWWSHGAEQLKTKGKGERENEERLPSSFVYQCKLLTRQAFPSSPSLCFPGLHFD